MARWEELPDYEQTYLAGMKLPEFKEIPWTPAKPLAESRIALISTAGIERKSDKPYPFFSGEYRMIPTDVDPGDLVMSHLSPNFDRTGFQQDINVVIPLERLRELEEEGVIGSMARFHYAFMGGSRPEDMEPHVPELAKLLRGDEVDTVLLCPV
ncbi:MAG: glycine/sarcosine/betaine reductase selenoprotein B family protein [Verrucomicrobia bacterium]|nr:glycine/sarcosine/betaine reductase selenoprotein B family protein [Verrucomicrobiota bacterium]